METGHCFVLGSIKAEEYCKSKSTNIRGFYESAIFANSLDLKRGKDENGWPKRNKVYVIFDIGYVCWNLSPIDNGIMNYDPYAYLRPYNNKEEDFAEGERKFEDIIGFIPIDMKSLDVLIRNGNFDADYLKYWIGIDLRHTEKVRLKTRPALTLINTL